MITSSAAVISFIDLAIKFFVSVNTIYFFNDMI